MSEVKEKLPQYRNKVSDTNRVITLLTLEEHIICQKMFGMDGIKHNGLPNLKENSFRYS